MSSIVVARGNIPDGNCPWFVVVRGDFPGGNCPDTLYLTVQVAGTAGTPRAVMGSHVVVAGAKKGINGTAAQAGVVAVSHS